MTTFSGALIDLKYGRRVARKGWNGKGMWIALIGGNNWGVGGNAPYDHPGAGYVKHLPFIAMKTADDGFVPWLASQTDILADDWETLP